MQHPAAAAAAAPTQGRWKKGSTVMNKHAQQKNAHALGHFPGTTSPACSGGRLMGRSARAVQFSSSAGTRAPQWGTSAHGKCISIPPQNFSSNDAMGEWDRWNTQGCSSEPCSSKRRWDVCAGMRMRCKLALNMLLTSFQLATSPLPLGVPFFIFESCFLKELNYQNLGPKAKLAQMSRFLLITILSKKCFKQTQTGPALGTPLEPRKLQWTINPWGWDWLSWEILGGGFLLGRGHHCGVPSCVLAKSESLMHRVVRDSAFQGCCLF